VSEKTFSEQDEAQAALAALQGGLGNARQLVERTRSLLTGDAPYDEGEAAMSAGQAAAAAESEIIQNPLGE
jgi:hypothetical protein